MAMHALLKPTLVLLMLVISASAQTPDPLSSCTQTNSRSLDACVASQIDSFLSSFDSAQSTTSFNYGSVGSFISSLQSSLTLTPQSLTSGSYTGPFVSDIANSYSQYTATRTGTGGSVFSFDTSSFVATATKPSSTTDASTGTLTSVMTVSRTTNSGGASHSSNGVVESAIATTTSRAAAAVQHNFDIALAVSSLGLVLAMILLL